MVEIKFREWQAVWLKAVVEPLGSWGLVKLVNDAETAINLRIETLRTVAGETEERRALADAQKSLRYLKDEHFKYSTVETATQPSNVSTA